MRLRAGIMTGWLLAASAAYAGDRPPEVAAVIEAARAAGLPAEALEAKAKEGEAKGVPGPTIAAYLEGLRKDLAAADVALGGEAQGEDRGELLVAVVAARRVGVSAAAFGEAARLPNGLRAPAVRALADLVGAGVSEPAALALVRQASARGDARSALRDTVTAAFTRIAEGEPPSLAAEHAAAASGQASAPAWGAGGKSGKTPNGKGVEHAPGQQKK